MSPSNPPAARYSLVELADLAGVTPRTIRYYLGQGLLPTVGAGGPGPKYDDTHLARLRLIRRLQEHHQPLAAIRTELSGLDDDEIQAMVAEPTSAGPHDSALDYIRRVTSAGHQLAEPPARASAMAPPPSFVMSAGSLADAAPAPARIERSQWERVTLGPDVELHTRRPLPRSTAKRVDRLIDIARTLLEEELT